MRTLIALAMIFFMSTTFAKGSFSIKSTSFNEGETIPVKYTCSGEDLSPQISWTDVPQNTQSLALIVSDPDAPAGTWYHWVVFNIPANTKEFNENIQTYPPESIVGVTSYNKNRYNGPCPPPGKPHHYIFTLYALDSKMSYPNSVDAKILQDAMKKHILETATLTGLFQRNSR